MKRLRPERKYNHKYNHYGETRKITKDMPQEVHDAHNKRLKEIEERVRREMAKIKKQGGTI